MPSMGASVALIKLILGESAKYFCLLVFSVLAIRLWRMLPKTSGKHRQKNLLLACLASAVAGAVGYFSICHSLSLLYSHYGMRAFALGNFSSALSLYQTSSRFWDGPDALGQQGICLLWTGQPDQGRQLLEAAKARRHGQSSTDEQFYEGGYDFFHGQPDRAVPLLEAAAPDLSHRWSAIKLLAVIQLDKNQADGAAQTMQPFLQVEVKPGEYDHAYIMAALDLAAGKTNDASVLLGKFSTETTPAFWKPRLEKLQAKIRSPTP